MKTNLGPDWCPTGEYSFERQLKAYTVEVKLLGVPKPTMESWGWIIRRKRRDEDILLQLSPPDFHSFSPDAFRSAEAAAKSGLAYLYGYLETCRLESEKLQQAIRDELLRRLYAPK